MSQKILSILIPFYNDEKYVEETLNSVFSAVSKENESCVEFIFIDDGSTDKTGKILEKYHKTHDFTLLTQTNKGTSFTTKRLIGLSTAEYCFIVDHDDLLEKQSIDKIISYLQQHRETDLLIFNHCDFYDDNSHCTMYIDGCNFEKNDGQSVFVELIKTKHYTDPLWNRVMSREMVLKNRIFTGHPYELDLLQSILLYFSSANVGYIPELLYYHRVHALSQSHLYKTMHFIAKCHLHTIDVLKNLIDDSSKGMRDDFLNALYTKINDLYFGAIAFGLARNEHIAVDKNLVKDIEKYSWTAMYGKWNRKYIYRPIINIFGVKMFYYFKWNLLEQIKTRIKKLFKRL